MQYSRRISLSLTAAFLLLVFGMPLSQAALELARGDRPHALELLLHVPTKANLRQFERELDNAPSVSYTHLTLPTIYSV